MAGLLDLLSQQQQQPPPQQKGMRPEVGLALMGFGQGMSSLGMGQAPNMAPYAQAIMQMREQSKPKQTEMEKALADPRFRAALAQMPPQVAEKILQEMALSQYGASMPEPAGAPDVEMFGEVPHVWDGQKFGPAPGYQPQTDPVMNMAPPEGLPPQILQIWQTGDAKIRRDILKEFTDAGFASSGPSAAEQKIARIMETTNPLTGKPYTREEAIVAAEYHALAPDGTVADTRGGDRVGVPDAIPPLEGPAADGRPDVPEVGTGATGFFTSVGNTVFDSIFREPINEGDLQAQTQLAALNNQTLRILSAEVDGRPTVFDKERIEATLPKGGRFFEGPGATSEKALNTAVMAGEMYRDLAQIVNGKGYTASQRAEARALLPKVKRIYDEYSAIYARLHVKTLGQPDLGGAGGVDPSDVDLMNELLEK